MKIGWRVREMSIEKEHAQLIDSGAYECRVSNTNGLITAKFDVQVTPSGTLPPFVGKWTVSAGMVASSFDADDPHPMNVTTVLGGTATFQCKVKSVTLPMMKWLKQLDNTDHSAAIDVQV
jgi:hypothetical protein